MLCCDLCMSLWGGSTITEPPSPLSRYHSVRTSLPAPTALAVGSQGPCGGDRAGGCGQRHSGLGPSCCGPGRQGRGYRRSCGCGRWCCSAGHRLGCGRCWAWGGWRCSAGCWPGSCWDWAWGHACGGWSCSLGWSGGRARRGRGGRISCALPVAAAAGDEWVSSACLCGHHRSMGEQVQHGTLSAQTMACL